jgi:hypothetical protein
MTVPILALQAFSHMLHAEMMAATQREKNARDVRLAEIQAAITRERIQAQRDVATLLVETAKHVFDRKIDVLQASFNAVIALIQESHTSLIASREAAQTAVLAATTKRDRLIANQRLGQIDKELARLEHEGAKLHADMQMFLQTIDMHHPLQALPFTRQT